jgi:hypothetical protein
MSKLQVRRVCVLTYLFTTTTVHGDKEPVGFILYILSVEAGKCFETLVAIHEIASYHTARDMKTADPISI